MRMRRAVLAVVVALGLGLGCSGPVGAQERELPTGAGRVVEKVAFQVLVARIQLEVQVADILDNHANAIPGK